MLAIAPSPPPPPFSVGRYTRARRQQPLPRLPMIASDGALQYSRQSTGHTETVPASWPQNPAGPASLDVAHLHLELLELLLDLGVLLGHLLVLGLPRVALGLKSLHLPLEVSGLDVCLAEPVVVSKSAFRPVIDVADLGVGRLLLVGLPQRLVGLLGLLLEQLQSPGEGLVLGAVLLAVFGGLLQVCHLLLELLDVSLEQAVLVLQRRDLLLLGQVLLLEGLDLSLVLFGLGRGLVRLQAELVHFLGAKTCRQLRDRASRDETLCK